MKNCGLDNLQTNMITSDHLIKKLVGSYQQIEKIDTFGTPELDLEAFLSIFNSRSLSFKAGWAIEYNFECSRGGRFSISKTLCIS